MLSHDHNGYYAEEESGIRKREKLSKRTSNKECEKGGGEERNPYLIS